MSTDQTGVNVPTQDDAAEGSQGRAPRSSRRAIRQAERAAEREAILTGQQPLLTRREMRRLREEAAALKAAVEAGEITPEQARALQDPTADQPEAASSASEAGEAGEAGSAAPGSPRSGASAQSPQAAAAWSSAQSAHSAPGAHSPAAASAGSAASAASIDRPLGDDTVQAPAVAESSSPSSASSPQPEAEEQPGPSWRSLTADEAVAISELPTGLMDAVDLPIISAEAERAAAEQVSGEPAPVPTRSSLRERLETGQVPSVAGLGAEADGGSGAAGQAAASTWAQQPAAPAQEAPGAQIDDGAQALPAWQADQRADEAAVLAADAVPVQEAQAEGVPGAPGAAAGAVEPSGGQAAGQAVGQEAPVAATPSSVRRPIVKIPAAAQGVRTVNVSTGELSAIQPVSPAEDAAADQVGQDGAQDAVAVEAVGEVSQDAQETTVQEAVAIEGGADFEGSGAPQWKSLRERMTSDNSLVGGQQPVSPYSTTTTGAEETTSVEYAPVAEGGFPVAGAGAPGAVGSRGATWDQVPSTVPAVAEVNLSQDEEPQRSGGGVKVALILLVVIVVALLVLALVWYLMSGGSGTSAAGLHSSVEPWIQQII